MPAKKKEGIAQWIRTCQSTRVLVLGIQILRAIRVPFRVLVDGLAHFPRSTVSAFCFAFCVLIVYLGPECTGGGASSRPRTPSRPQTTVWILCRCTCR